MTACTRCGTAGRLLNTDRRCQLCSLRPIDLHPHIDYTSVSLPDSGIPNHEQENRMHRVLRWEVPVDDAWHKVGAGAVVHVAAREYKRKPGDLVEVWTLEEGPDAGPWAGHATRAVTVVGTGHPLPADVYHIGTAVVPTFHILSGPTRGSVDHIESAAGLVWHVFAKHDPEAERQALAEQGRRLASTREDLIAQGVDPNELPVPLHPDPLPPLGSEVHGITRDAQVRTVEDEATSLAYWLANELGEHVDDQDGETLTQTVQRLVAHRLADAYRRAKAGDGPQIGGFQRGNIVTIGPNGDQFEGQAGVVATLDHDHGWRLWVRVGADVHDMHAPALYLSPDDIDMVEIS